MEQRYPKLGVLIPVAVLVAVLIRPVQLAEAGSPSPDAIESRVTEKGRWSLAVGPLFPLGFSVGGRYQSDLPVYFEASVALSGLTAPGVGSRLIAGTVLAGDDTWQWDLWAGAMGAYLGEMRDLNCTDDSPGIISSKCLGQALLFVGAGGLLGEGRAAIEPPGTITPMFLTIGTGIEWSPESMSSRVRIGAGIASLLNDERELFDSYYEGRHQILPVVSLRLIY